MTRAKYWDCIECADQHAIADMYPCEGSWICEECFADTYNDEEEIKLDKEKLLKELLERKQFWEYELEILDKEGRTNDRELRGAIAGIDVAIQYIKGMTMDYETVIDIKSKPHRDPAMRDCLQCEDRTVHIEGRCAICGGN